MTEVTELEKIIIDEIKSNINKLVQEYMFEPNDEKTRAKIKEQSIRTLSVLREKWNDAEFDHWKDTVVVCDDTNNTDKVLKANEFKLDVYLKFKRHDSHQFHVLECTVKSTSINFTHIVGV